MKTTDPYKSWEPILRDATCRTRTSERCCESGDTQLTGGLCVFKGVEYPKTSLAYICFFTKWFLKVFQRFISKFCLKFCQGFFSNLSKVFLSFQWQTLKQLQDQNAERDTQRAQVPVIQAGGWETQRLVKFECHKGWMYQEIRIVTFL